MIDSNARTDEAAPRADDARGRMRPTLRLALQRVWHRSDPLLSSGIHRLPRLLKLLLFRALARDLRIASVAVMGETGVYVASPLDLGVISEYMFTGSYSPALMTFLLRRFEQAGGGTFVDIGANIGLTSRPFAERGIVCHCFEPDRTNFRWLSLNIRARELTQVHLYDVALFDRNGTVEFELSDWNHGDHRVHTSNAKGAFGEQHRTVTNVPCRKLDDVINLSTVTMRPLVVKIDTQGAEAHVIRGGSKLIAAADVLSLEFCPYLVRRMGEHEQSLIDFAATHFNHGVIGNWHRDATIPALLPIKEVAQQLSAASSAMRSTAHLDVLLTK